MKTKVNTSASLMAKWEQRMRKAGNKFALLLTNRATYDRVAVIVDRAFVLVIQYPHGSSKRRNLDTHQCGSENFTIKQETIKKDDIVNIQYYTEN